MKRVRIFFLFFKWMFFNAQCGRVLSPSKEGGGQREAHPKLALSPINIHSWIGFPSLLLFRDKCELKSVAADLRREASYTLAWGLRLKNKKKQQKNSKETKFKNVPTERVSRGSHPDRKPSLSSGETFVVVTYRSDITISNPQYCCAGFLMSHSPAKAPFYRPWCCHVSSHPSFPQGP